MSVNKVLVEPSHAHSLTRHLRLLSHYNGQTEEFQQELCGLQSPKYLLSEPLQKTSADLRLEGYRPFYFWRLANITNNFKVSVVNPTNVYFPLML